MSTGNLGLGLPRPNSRQPLIRSSHEQEAHRRGPWCSRGWRSGVRGEEAPAKDAAPAKTEKAVKTKKAKKADKKDAAKKEGAEKSCSGDKGCSGKN